VTDDYTKIGIIVHDVGIILDYSN